MILSVHHTQITIPTGEEKAARDFYCGILGLQEIAKPDALGDRGGFWLEVSGFPVHIGVEDSAGRKPSKAHVAYLVNDLESWRVTLASNDIQILEGIPIPGYDRFEFRDPFGNRVEFLQRID